MGKKITCTIVVIGAPGAGKTSLIARLNKDKFKKATEPTKVEKLSEFTVPFKQSQISLRTIDTSGEVTRLLFVRHTLHKMSSLEHCREMFFDNIGRHGLYSLVVLSWCLVWHCSIRLNGLQKLYKHYFWTRFCPVSLNLFYFSIIIIIIGVVDFRQKTNNKT
jgi:hypothetical protein